MVHPASKSRSTKYDDCKTLAADHGIVCHLPGEHFGYFGWPTVERLDDGKLLVASSGLRAQHVCPYGKTVVNTSTDNGATWSLPRVIQDSPLDDRDAGLCNLGGGNVLVSWASFDNRVIHRNRERNDRFRFLYGDEPVDEWEAAIAAITDEDAARHCGSWIMLSADSGETWGDKIQVPVYTPHGPIRLRSGDLMYLGNRSGTDRDATNYNMVTSARSSDNGVTWTHLADAPQFPTAPLTQYSEPSVLELPSGKLIGMIRVGGDVRASGVLDFSMMQTESENGGDSWSVPRPLNFHGAPPHLIHHSSGVLIMIYSFRLLGYGQRLAISRDEGATWEHDWIVRDNGPDWDLGYPSTVEMDDGGLFSVYYQKMLGDDKCSLLWSRWTLPDS